MIRVPRAAATTTQWHKGHDFMTKPSRPCLTSFKYKVSALGAMAGGWSFLSVRLLTLLLILLVSSRGSFGYWTTSSSPAQHSRQNKSMREPAKLRRGDYDPVSRRSAFQERISHPGKDGRKHRGGPAWVAR